MKAELATVLVFILLFALGLLACELVALIRARTKKILPD